MDSEEAGGFPICSSSHCALFTGASGVAEIVASPLKGLSLKDKEKEGVLGRNERLSLWLVVDSGCSSP